MPFRRADPDVSVRNLTAAPFFLPAKARVAIQRQIGRMPRSDRGVPHRRSPRAIGRPRWHSVAAVFCTVAFLASSPSWIDRARADQSQSGAQTVRQQRADSIAPFVAEAAQRFAISERWIRAIMRAESGGNSQARSPKGAIGLMQIMPGTWTELRARYDLGDDPYDPRDNILAGTAYLRELHDRYGRPGFLAAYNAGPGRYEHHLATGRALPEETQSYIAAVMPMLDVDPNGAQIAVASKSNSATHSPLFVVRLANNSADSQSSKGVRSGGSPSASAVADLTSFVPRSSNLFVRTANSVRPQ